MPTKPITKRLRYWLDHLNNTAASGCTLVTYARNHALKAKKDISHLSGEKRSILLAFGTGRSEII